MIIMTKSLAKCDECGQSELLAILSSLPSPHLLIDSVAHLLVDSGTLLLVFLHVLNLKKFKKTLYEL